MQCSRQCCCIGTSVIMFSSALIAVASFLVIRSAAGSLIHAECEVNWQIPLPCSQVREGVVAMMGEWQGGADTPLDEARCGTTSNSCPNLPCGQKCLYTYKADESSDMKILGVHYTPAKRYSDSFNYELTNLDNGNKCGVKGYSTSDTWYAVLDFGTNFCNIRNLLDGAFDTGKWPRPDGVDSLDNLPGFDEETSDSKCTQYSSRDCTRY